jgi:hypothetical protein
MMLTSDNLGVLQVLNSELSTPISSVFHLWDKIHLIFASNNLWKLKIHLRYYYTDKFNDIKYTIDEDLAVIH